MQTIDPKIRLLIDELDELAKSRNDAWQIPRIEGELLYQIARGTGAKTVLEVGTSYGFSGLHWGAAVKPLGGTVHTIDISEKKVQSSSETFRRAGLEGVVKNHLGDAKQILPTIPGPIDLAFLDADKEPLREYFDLVWLKIRVGGSVLIDNVTSHKQQLRPFVEYVRSRDDVSSVEVPVGNGVEWAIRTR